MLQRFLAFIEKEQLPGGNDRVLLAVSGGVDSVVLFDLFCKSGFDFGVAHINHRLRGEASETDAAFVEKLAQDAGKNFYLHTIGDLAAEIGRDESLQAAARRIRYHFLEQTAQEQQYTFIATAHHLDDNLETVLINLLRGSGLGGLRGMLPKNGRVIHPLLFAQRREIEGYAQQEKLAWRHDHSNDSDDYTRNKLRHHIIPSLRELQPGLEKVVNEMTVRLRQSELLLEKAAELYRQDYVTVSENGWTIDAKRLAESPAADTLLYLWLRDYGFNNTQLQQALQSAAGGQSGTFFSSGTHRLVCDRGNIQLVKNDDFAPVFLRIHPGGQYAGIEINTIARPSNFPAAQSPYTAFFDPGRLHFPLTLRHWQAGDRFVPLGMEQHKKVSDLLTDLKIPLHEKEKVLVLESGGEIAWVAGLRISNRFKVSETATELLSIRLDPAQLLSGTKS